MGCHCFLRKLCLLIFIINKLLNQMVVLMSMVYVNIFAKYIILWKCMYVYTLLRVPWTLKEILRAQGDPPVHPKGNQSWIFFGRSDAEAEALITWPPDAEHWLIGKGPDIGKDWRQEKGTTEDEMVGWHHQLDGHEFEQVPGAGDWQGGLACYSSATVHGATELDMTE